MRHVPIETARGRSGESGVCVHALVALVSSSVSAASSPPGLTELGVQGSSKATWRTASATSALAVVRIQYLTTVLCRDLSVLSTVCANEKCFVYMSEPYPA